MSAFLYFLLHLALSVLDLSDVGGTIRPPLLFLIMVGFWWALSLSSYHSEVLVGRFSASLSLWCSGGPFLRFLIIVVFWWALSLLPYHSGVLVDPFSASLS